MPHPGRYPLLARAFALLGICVAAVVGAMGAIAAPAVVAGGMFCAAVIGLAAGARVRELAAGDRAARTSAGCRAGVVVGGALTVGSTVVAGSALLLGPAGVFLLLVPVIIGGAWWLRRPRAAPDPARPLHRSDHLLLRVAQPRVPPPAPSSPAGRPAAALPAPGLGPAGLSTAQLCLAWQHTYFALLDLPAAASRTDLIEFRRLLLDEIERRDPAGFTRWIDSEARPGSNPGRFVAGEG